LGLPNFYCYFFQLCFSFLRTKNRNNKKRTFCNWHSRAVIFQLSTQLRSKLRHNRLYVLSSNPKFPNDQFSTDITSNFIFPNRHFVEQISFLPDNLSN
jgi:hypothetical protein